MRIWTLHPKHIDSKGLVALWRETLLAKNVLEGNTKGYRNHPQLGRFKACSKPLDSINYYLQEIWKESQERNFNFDKTKFSEIDRIDQINVTDGQIAFEIEHLQHKLKARDLNKYKMNQSLSEYEIHPLFNPIKGEIEPWEKV